MLGLDKVELQVLEVLVVVKTVEEAEYWLHQEQQILVAVAVVVEKVAELVDLAVVELLLFGTNKL